MDGSLAHLSFRSNDRIAFSIDGTAHRDAVLEQDARKLASSREVPS